MNVHLEKLFLKHNLSYKDCYEIQQIYDFLPPNKRQNLIDNFDVIVWELLWLKKEIGFEQEMLLWETLKNIESKVSQMKKKQILQWTGNILSDLKKQI